jgi:molybdenum cofactor cytidylyltransferase
MDAAWQTRERMTEQSAASPPDVAGIVLAAGHSSRMGPGHNKLLTELDGKSLVIYSVDAALEAGLTDVCVVTGHDAERVRAALADRDVRFVHNPDHASGLASSLRAALLAIGGNRAGFLVLLGDMPRVRADDLRRLVSAFEHSGRRAICVPEHAGRRGNPVLWPASERDALLALRGDVGGRELLRARDGQLVRVPIDHDGVLLDVDTPNELAAVATRADR